MNNKLKFLTMVIADLALIGTAIHFKSIYAASCAALCGAMIWDTWKLEKANDRITKKIDELHK